MVRKDIQLSYSFILGEKKFHFLMGSNVTSSFWQEVNWSESKKSPFRHNPRHRTVPPEVERLTLHLDKWILIRKAPRWKSHLPPITAVIERPQNQFFWPHLSSLPFFSFMQIAFFSFFLIVPDHCCMTSVAKVEGLSSRRFLVIKSQ